jgi:hypothetical protein
LNDASTYVEIIGTVVDAATIKMLAVIPLGEKLGMCSPTIH